MVPAKQVRRNVLQHAANVGSDKQYNGICGYTNQRDLITNIYLSIRRKRSTYHSY